MTSSPEVTRLTPLTLNELAQIAGSLQSLVGAQFQEVVQSGDETGLGFYHDQEMFWLWFDLNPSRPVVVRIAEKPPTRKKQVRPLTLFLRSRFLGRRLQSVRADLVRGRVLVFSFYRSSTEETQAPIEFEALLIPHAANLIAKDGASSISENKPKETTFAPQVQMDEGGRSWDAIENAWWGLQKAKVAQANTAPTEREAREKKWRKAVEKKEQALVRMNEELHLKLSNVHRDLGEWLKANGSLDSVPQELREHLDSEKSLSWNIEDSFRRAKENERKSEGTRTRIALVAKELEVLKATGPAKFDEGLREKRTNESLLSRADAKGRRHTIGDLDVYVGKSASDNLALLRRAQPFDLWLHLRDQPGSHAILRRTRGRNVTDAELREAGIWVIEQSLGKRARELAGEKFDMLIVECRFVRPIKGDKLGRVNYSNDRVMPIRL